MIDTGIERMAARIQFQKVAASVRNLMAPAYFLATQRINKPEHIAACLLISTMFLSAGPLAAAPPVVKIAQDGGVADATSQASALYVQAQEAYEAEDWQRAWTLIGEAIAAEPDNTQYLKFQSYVAGKRNDHAGVMQAAQHLLTLNNEDAEAYAMRGNAHYFLGDRQQALADYRRALALDFRDSDFYRNYLHTLNELRGHEELIKVYDTFLQRHEEDVDALPLKSDLPFYASLAYYARKDYPRTIELLTEAIELSPDFDGYYGNRALTYDDTKQYSLALADYAKAMQLAPKDPLHPYNRGVTWLHMQEYQKAFDDFSTARKLGKDDSEIWLNLGVAEERLGHDRQALKAYDRALKLDPDNALARANRATLLREQGKTEAADRDHALALSTLPDANAAVLRYNDAQARMRVQDWAGALPLLQEAVRLKPDFLEAWVNLGAAHMHLGNRQAGLDAFNDVLARFPTSTKALINRAKALEEMQDYTSARRDYLRALELDPTNADYMERLAQHYKKTGDRREAKKYFERARRLAASADIFINYSAFLLENGDQREALVVAREGANKFPDNYRLLVNLGNAQSETGAFKEGIATYRRAIAQQPRSLDAYYNLGNLYAFDQKEPARAIEWYRRALQQQADPELDVAGQREQRLGIRLNLATALDLAGDRASALQALQETIDADPDDYRGYYNRAGFALDVGDEQAARRDFTKAVARIQATSGSLDDDPERLEHLGYALFHLDRTDEAVGKLERHLQLQPGNHLARSNLGFVLLDLNRPTEAQRQFEQAFTAEPDEIDVWLGLLACASLSGDPGKLASLKSQFAKRYNGRYQLENDLLKQLQGEGYWYSASFKNLWSQVISAP